MGISFRLAFAVIASLSSTVIAAEATSTVAEIRTAASATRQRVTERGAAWRAVHSSGNGEPIAVDVVRTPRAQAWTYTVGKYQLARVVERGGVWYVDERGRRATCRPFEYPFRGGTFQTYQNRAGVQLLTEITPEQLGTFERREGAVAHFRAPVSPEDRRLFEGMLRQIDDLQRQYLGSIDPEAVKARVSAMRDTLERGKPAAIDVDQGILVSREGEGFSTRIEGFRLLNAGEEPPALSVDDRRRDDVTRGPLAESDPNDLAMVMHTEAWQPGVPTPDTDGRVWNVKTGRMWRIGLPTEAAMPGCFLPGRRSMVAVGVTSHPQTCALYEINLDTGATRRLGGDVPPNGIMTAPVVSADGKTLASNRLDPARGIQWNQVYLIDVASGKARPIGQPANVIPVGWHPDGRSLVVERIEPGPPNVPGPRSVCRMDLDGKVTVLRTRATNSRVLAPQKRILFRDHDSAAWRTCDLSGKNEQAFKDVPAGEAFYFPTQSPDGGRLMLLHDHPQRGPTPYVFEIGKSNGTGQPANAPPGFWGSPSW